MLPSSSATRSAITRFSEQGGRTGDTSAGSRRSEVAGGIAPLDGRSGTAGTGRPSPRKARMRSSVSVVMRLPRAAGHQLAVVHRAAADVDSAMPACRQ